MNVFVSYSHEDSAFVDRLCIALERTSATIVIDKCLITGGDSLVDLFTGISEASFHVPVFSSSSVQSAWVNKEVRTGIVKEIEGKSDFKIVPIYIDDCSLPEPLHTALLDKLYIDFSKKTFEDGVRELAKSINQSFDDPAILHSQAQSESGKIANPFRRIRAEHFETSDLIGRYFALPEGNRYERFVQVKPTVILGGRGSGKSMLLKSLEPTAWAAYNDRSDLENLPHVGIYIKCHSGAFATSATAAETLVPDEAREVLFTNELILVLLQALINQFGDCARLNLLQMSSSREHAIAESIVQQLNPMLDLNNYRSLDQIESLIRLERNKIVKYVQERILGEPTPSDRVALTFDNFAQICKKVMEILYSNSTVPVYVLIDEHENLSDVQKRVINTLTKIHAADTFTVKIASKFGSFNESMTIERQEIEEPHDYSIIGLDYDLSAAKERSQYKSFLTSICQKVLATEGYSITDISTLLEEPEQYGGYSQDQIDQEIEKSFSPSGPVTETSRGYYKEAAVHRLRLNDGQAVQFAGVDVLVSLSSGITRVFLELCGMSFFLASTDGTDVKNGERVPIVTQTDAAFAISRYYLSRTASNIEEYGPRIHRFIVDLGDVIRAKLKNHPSEPESSRISIKDHELLDKATHFETAEILRQCLVHSIFHSPEPRMGMRPKHTQDVQPLQLVLNRIFAPSLQISLRSRWPLSISTHDLISLLDFDDRQRTKSSLIRRIRTAADSSKAQSRWDLN